MALSSLIHSIKSNLIRTKTAYHTHFLSTKALHQQPDAVAVPPSRGSTFSRQTAHRVPATPSDRSSHVSENEHLPPLVPPPGATFRQHLHNGSTHAVHFNNNTTTTNKSPPPSPKKYATKTATTTTTIKKAVKGGPVMQNGSPTHSNRTTSSESNRKVRKFWWSPRRSEIAVRSDINRYRHVHSKIGSLINIEHQPGGGQVSIRDDPIQWQATSRIDSLSNANYSPPAPRISVRSEKIKWDAQSKIGSMINIDHKPAGGNVAIRDDKLDYNHVAPRIDCGFLA